MNRKTPTKRILLVSYHFGDGCETGGFRWNAFVADLLQFGWEVDVIALARPGLGPVGNPLSPPGGPLEVFAASSSSTPQRLVAAPIAVPRALLRLVRRSPLRGSAHTSPEAKRLPALSEVSVWRVGVREPLRTRVGKALQGLTTYASDRIWCRRALRVGNSLMRGRHYHAVIVSSPPHTTQIVGAELGRRYGVPYVADFRDPWVAGLGPLKAFMDLATRAASLVHEPQVLRAASVVVYNTHAASLRSEGVFGNAVRRREVVPNGYDGKPSNDRPDADVFRILFAGWLHPYMDVRALIAGTARLIHSRQISPERIRLEFLGTGPEFGGVPLMQIAAACGVDNCTVVHARCSRDEAFEFQERAAVLVAYTCPHGLEIAMKFYDYVQMRGSLLLIGHSTGALAQAAARVGCRVVEMDDEAGIDQILNRAYERWLAGDYHGVIDQEELFARRHRSLEMHAILESLGSADAAVNERVGHQSARLINRTTSV